MRSDKNSSEPVVIKTTSKPLIAPVAIEIFSRQLPKAEKLAINKKNIHALESHIDAIEDVLEDLHDKAFEADGWSPEYKMLRGQIREAEKQIDEDNRAIWMLIKQREKILRGQL